MRLFEYSHAAAFALLVFGTGCGSRDAPAPAGSAARTAAPSGTATLAAAATSAAAAPAPPTTPDGVAKVYLELGAAGDLSKIKDLVDSKCHATKVGDVDAVKMLGARMTLTETTTSVESEAGDTAKVKYVVKGSVDAKTARAETDIFGKKLEVKVGTMSMNGVTQSGVLTLKKLDGRWVVTC